MNSHIDLPVDYPSSTSSKALTVVSLMLCVLSLVTWIPSFSFPTDVMSETFSAFATASMMWVASLILGVIAISNERDRVNFRNSVTSINTKADGSDEQMTALPTSKAVIPVNIISLTIFPAAVILFLIVEGTFL
jgi:hypothetical protein